VIRQCSSQLQKYKAVEMSRQMGVEQRRYAAGMADTQDLLQASQTQIAPRVKWGLMK